MRSPLGYWTARFLGGLAVLLACGLGAPSAAIASMRGSGSFVLVDTLLGTLGFWFALTAVTPLVHVLGTTGRLRRHWGNALHEALANASTAQRVFLLLLAVAEADGKAGPAERQLVRTFLRGRFATPDQQAELDAWQESLRPPRNLTELARLIAHELAPGECATIYSWSCLLAFADGALQPPEFRALQQIADGLGLAPHHAAFLFEFAQQSARRQGRAGANHAGRDGSTSAGAHRPGSGRTPPPAPSNARDEALAILGLTSEASPDQIRRRHRELVRRFHPDAHRTLGPVAQREATDRFLAIQRAYEQLGG